MNVILEYYAENNKRNELNKVLLIRLKHFNANSRRQVLPIFSISRNSMFVNSPCFLSHYN